MNGNAVVKMINDSKSNINNYPHSKICLTGITKVNRFNLKEIDYRKG